MKFLVISGMDQLADQEHIKAKCPTQSSFFKSIILSQKPNSSVDIYSTYLKEFSNSNLSEYDAFFWTGGLGNIYEKNEFNSSQLKLAENLLNLNKPIWGSCWGLQVLVTVFGGKIIKSNKPEFGFSSNIKILNKHYIFENKLDCFTAPGHHYDVIEKMPIGFNVLAENNFSIQAILSIDSNIVCTQYHPELPYDFIGKLMFYWKNNYLNLMTKKKFDNLIKQLNDLENKDTFLRKLELINWINSL